MYYMNNQDMNICTIINNNCINNKSIVTIRDYSNSIHIQNIYVIWVYEYTYIRRSFEGRYYIKIGIQEILVEIYLFKVQSHHVRITISDLKLFVL